MKNKGFTLIELIAVVVMMGMILLIVFPATSRLLRSNEDKKYDSYYDAIQEALELYARTRRDELGGAKGSGCANDKKISELKEYDYIEEFKDEKDVTCLSPGDFTTAQLNALGINTSKQYENIRIDNNKGNIKVKYSMVCVRNYNDPSIMSLVYSNLVEKNSTCENYVPVVTNSLYNEIKEKYSTLTSTLTNADVKYITGNPSNNYVYYSGKLWRIISFNDTDRTIKLVTDDTVAIANFNNVVNSTLKVNNFPDSNIYYWLQSVFYPTLRNPEKYLFDATWSYNGSSLAPTLVNGGKTIVSKVGLLNTFEYGNGSSFLNISKRFWLINPYGILIETKNEAVMVNDAGELMNSDVSNFFGVRPSVVLKPNITYINGGSGTKNNPYKLIGDTSANVGTPLNTRFAGEYVQFNNTLFRISTIDSNYTKLIGVDTLPIDASIASTIPYITSANYNAVAGKIGFHYFDKLYSDNTFIGEYLKRWSVDVVDNLIEADFCRMTLTNETSQTIGCPPESVISTNIAIPRIGELYAVGSNKVYWTINNKEEDKLNLITPVDGRSSTSVDDLASILPVVVINNTVLITGGNGTEINPYTIG